MSINRQVYMCMSCLNLFWEESNDAYRECLRCRENINSNSLDDINGGQIINEPTLNTRRSLNSRKRSFNALSANDVPVDDDCFHILPSSRQAILSGESKVDCNDRDLSHQSLDQPNFSSDSDPIVSKSKETNDSIFLCVICRIDLTSKNLSSRTAHLKKCSKESNISTKDLMAMLAPTEQTGTSIFNDSTDTSRYNEVKEVLMPQNTPEVSAPSSAKIPLMFLPQKMRDGLKNLQYNENKVKPARPKKQSGWSKFSSNGTKKFAPSFKKIQTLSMTKPIIVDGFQYACNELSNCYFLTHFHSDHYIGLDKNFDSGFIYCSVTTAALVTLKLGVKSDKLIPLSLDVQHTITAGGEDVLVTLTDANHCPGSVCILFQFKNGKKVLHTGDFRWDRKKMLSSNMFQSLVYVEPTRPTESSRESKIIETHKQLTLYLDTTYCNLNYDFPPQEAAIKAVVDTVRQEAGKDKPLFLFGAYDIGKERVYMTVANDMNSKVHVENNRFKMINCYEDWSIEAKARITTNPSETNIWVVSMTNINFSYFDTVLKQKPGCRRVVAFQPTGWTHKPSSSASSLILNFRSNKNGHRIYSVPYSEHSSFGELVDCIRILRPHIVVPTVNTSEVKVKEQLQLLRDASGIYKN